MKYKFIYHTKDTFQPLRAKLLQLNFGDSWYEEWEKRIEGLKDEKEIQTYQPENLPQPNLIDENTSLWDCYLFLQVIDTYGSAAQSNEMRNTIFKLKTKKLSSSQMALLLLV